MVFCILLSHDNGYMGLYIVIEGLSILPSPRKLSLRQRGVGNAFDEVLRVVKGSGKFPCRIEAHPGLKLPAHTAGLPGKVLSFILCAFTPPIPISRDGARSGQPLACLIFVDRNLPSPGLAFISPSSTSILPLCMEKIGIPKHLLPS
jgi:hypothetical protein